MLQFGSILEPTWLHFGKVLGAKLGPSWHKIAPKVDPKNDQKMITFWIALGTDFNRFWAPTWLPIGETNVEILEHLGLLEPS